MLTTFFLVLAGAGFLASMAMHLLALLGGVLVGNGVITAMLVGVFVVLLPAFLGHPDAEPGRRGAFPWRSLSGWPRWSKVTIGALFVYLVWFCVSQRVPGRWGMGGEPLSPLLVQASCLVNAWLYAVCCALLYDKRRRTPPPTPF